MQRDHQAQLYDQQQQQIHVVGPDLRVEGGYETTKRRGVEDDFVIVCYGRDVRGHRSVFETRIAHFDIELKAFRAERDRLRAPTPSNGESSRCLRDVEDWKMSDITLAENDGGGQATDRIWANGPALIFYSENAATIHGFSLSIFEQIVKWAYTGSFHVPSEKVCDLLEAAAFFGIDRMKSKCEEYLLDKITLQNCLELCEFAELQTEPNGELHKGVLKFISENFSTRSVTDKFLSFDCVVSLRMLLADDNLNVANEKEVFDFLVKWTNHKSSTRSTHFDSLLRFVRFYQLSPRFLLDVVCNCKLIAGSEKGRKRIEAIKNACFQFLGSQRSFTGTNNAPLGSLLGVSVDTPRFLTIRQMIICVGGFGTNYLNSIEIFDPARGEWRLATGENQLRSERSELGVVCVAEKLFVVGGHDGDYLSTNECFDLGIGEWSSIAPLRNNRYGNALVALHEKWLYAIGGIENEDEVYLRSVERYDIERNKWNKMASMSVRRYGVAAAVYHDQIFVVGGYDRRSSLNSCERFDPIANRWTPIASMLHKRCWCGVAVVGDHLYAIGGDDSVSYFADPISHCERYSFAEDKWTAIKPLSTARQRLGVAVVGSNIFAIGGQGSNGPALKTVEVYDTLTGEWAPSASLNEPRYGHGVACSSSQFARNF